MARIRFQNVSKTYANGHAAVSDINLDIADQEFLVLLGPSGCGKSTTLNMIAGLEDISSGALMFDEQVMNNVPAHKRDVAMVFQSYALYPHKNVFENIAFGLRMRKVPEDELTRRVLDATKKLEITHLLKRFPSQLSGGQRQRVALGRAMVRQPSVFLMDEPLSNLDASLRISMRAQIRHLHAEMRSTFVYVTHDQAEALTLADRIVVMRDGSIQQIGTPDDIYERPANVFVASFLGSPAINLLDGELAMSGQQVVFQRGGLRIPLPAALICGPVGSPREVTLGLRAEDVCPVTPSTILLRCVLETAMPSGSDQFLGVKVEGATMFLRVGKDAVVRQGAAMEFGINPARLHVFDRATGVSLRGEAA